ncbi:Uncharacterized protein BM_BM13326 [Brugia malayi]|uniref:Bm13326 n=1 Tax=Brugia malayi TaxID=6279 RepID=A0A0J9Y5K6_BRUMA|nr:Uncharacterized protein BM_BM13326 [Brugia malayi]CDQ02408.1 Bm13326 [Brugia malayi]VIO96448.1 Uncharacterized protein BM_BM13326 [Brugia malayi]
MLFLNNLPLGKLKHRSLSAEKNRLQFKRNEDAAILSNMIFQRC